MTTRWSPAPDDLVSEADRTRWTRENPAPAVVGYLSAWNVLRDGGAWTVRRLALHLGWSRWSAESMLKRVRQDLQRWQGADDTTGTYGARPDENSHQTDENRRQLLVIPGGYAPRPDTVPDTVPDNRRARRSTTTTTTTATPTQITAAGAPAAQKPRAADVSVSKLWHAVEELRAIHLPGCRTLKLTAGRRKTLKARVMEHSTDAVLEVWRWALTSRNQRATYLRDHGYVRPDTLHRAAKFAGCLEMAQDDTRTQTRQMSAGGVDLDTFLADE